MGLVRVVWVMEGLISIDVIVCRLTEDSENFWFVMMLVQISMDVIILNTIS